MPISPESVTHTATAAVGNSASGIVGSNPERSALQVQLDPAAAAGTVVYLLLAASGTPGPTNFDVAITPGLIWDGLIGPSIYRGPIQAIASAVGPFNVAVVQF